MVITSKSLAVDKVWPRSVYETSSTDLPNPAGWGGEFSAADIATAVMRTRSSLPAKVVGPEKLRTISWLPRIDGHKGQETKRERRSCSARWVAGITSPAFLGVLAANSSALLFVRCHHPGPPVESCIDESGRERKWSRHRCSPGTCRWWRGEAHG